MKLLHNPSTGSPASDYSVSLVDIGITIAADQDHTIPQAHERLYATNNEVLTAVRDGSLQVGNGTSYYTDPIEGEIYLRTMLGNEAYISDAGSPVEIDEFSNVIVTDSYTGKKATAWFMNMLTIMRDIYNASDNPVYLEGHTPLLGTNGSVQYVLDIHEKHGWHRNEIRSLTYKRPKDLLIYYGWLNSFNYGVNAWTNEKVAQDMAKYDLLVFGDGIEDTGHGDYSNTQVIIPRIKELNPNAKIFGYVSVNQSLANFQDKVDDWNDLEVDGIFMDEAGYDFGSTTTNGRDAFNTKVDYVHNKTYANVCFANAWNMDHIIGTTNDASYPNTTWNPDLNESNLTNSDWYLLESLAVNTDAYGGNGYASKSDWTARGEKAMAHRYTYGINLASVGIIDNTDGNADDLFDFCFVSALMWALEGNGSSDTSYASSTATVDFQTRPDVKGLQNIWTLSPSVQEDVGDSDVYHRYVSFGKLSVDFSSGAETNTITKF